MGAEGDTVETGNGRLREPPKATVPTVLCRVLNKMLQ